MQRLMNATRLLLTLVVAALAACGGGGGGSKNSAPVISNLQISPTSALQYDGNGTVSITTSLDFADPGKDLATFYINSSDGDSISGDITGVAGTASGSIEGTVDVDTTQLGHFTFQVYVTDSSGNRSNTLSGAFDVNPNDTASHWSVRSLPIPTGSSACLRRVRWSGSLFVAVGARSDPVTGSMASTIMTSPDGATWTERDFGSAANLNDVVWTGNQFVAVGDQGAVLTSADGVVWSPQAIPPILGAMLNGVATSGARIIAVGSKAGATASLMLSSTDGVGWAEVPATFPGPLNAIDRSGSELVAVGAALGQSVALPMVVVSTDGASWSRPTISLPTMTVLYDVVWSGSEFVAVGYAGEANSSDGITWQQAGAGGGGNTVGFSGKRFLVCSSVYCESSTDGNAFYTTATMPTVGAMGSGIAYGTAWGDDRWVIVGTDSLVLTSP